MSIAITVPPRPLGARDGVHFLVLKGRTTGTEEVAFPPDGIEFEMRVGITKASGRGLLMPRLDANGEVDQIMQTHAVLLTSFPKDAAMGSWTLVGASPAPWAVEQAQQLIEEVLGDRDLFWDPLSMFCQGMITRFGPYGDVVPLLRMTNPSRTTIAILGHVPNETLKRRYMQALSDGQAKYRGILDFGILDDPNGRHRLDYLRGNTAALLHGLVAPVPEPPPGGMVAVVPDDFPAGHLPASLPHSLTKQEAADAQHVAAWLRQFAEVSVRDGWRNKGFVADLFSVRDQLGALVDTQADVALWLALQKLQVDLSACKSQLAAKTQELEAVQRRAAEIGDHAQRVVRDLGDVQQELRHISQAARLDGRELARLRALDPDGLVTQLAAARSEVAEYAKLLEVADGELKRPRGYSATGPHFPTR